VTPTDDRSLEELLGAYALDGCDADEAAAVEALLQRRPDLGDESTRLAIAAAWLGAVEATELPPALREAILATAVGDPLAAAAQLYEAEARRVADELDLLEPDRYDAITPNGLTARSLVVHIAAQETLLAQAAGRPVADVTLTDIHDRTAALIDSSRDRPYGDILELWRRAVTAVEVWARSVSDTGMAVEWVGLPMPPSEALTARAFENWVHRDDLRRVRGAAADPPPARELRLMAKLAMRTLPAGLAATGRVRSGRSARVVLTGAGGGTWHLPLDPSEDAVGTPDLTLTASALDWCLLAGERLDPNELLFTVEGDRDLADDLVAAAPAFATL
jgi:uncharacterized protein (TIGR03083 family)